MPCLRDSVYNECLSRPDKYIETSEHGLVIIAVTEADAGRYDCWMGASLLCSYNVTVDAHRCSPPSQSKDYQKIYSDWCHEFEKYKSAMKTWERKQAVSITLTQFFNIIFPRFLFSGTNHFLNRHLLFYQRFYLQTFLCQL